MKKEKLKQYWQITRETVEKYTQGSAITYAAAIAFYMIFSLPALLMIVITIGATLYEEDVVQGEMLSYAESMFGASSAEALEKILANASLDSSGTIATIIAIGTLLFSATTVFIMLQNSLNDIWKIKAKPEKGVIKFLVNRLLSLSMVVSIGFLLLVSLILDAVLVIFTDILTQFLDVLTVYIMTAVNIALSLGMATLVFALMFKVLPDGRVQWRDTWLGAFVTALLFAIGKYIISFIMSGNTYDSSYGAAGSVVIMLVWIYYSSMIFLLGAQFTAVYAQTMGGRILPSEHAVRIKQIEVEED